MVDAGVDRIPRTFLDALVEKAIQLSKHQGLWLNSLEILLSLHRIQTQESRILLIFLEMAELNATFARATHL